MASEERRAARRTGLPVEIREQVRERIVERSRPLSADGAVDRVLSSTVATVKLLHTLARRLREDPPADSTDVWRRGQLTPGVIDLHRAHSETVGEIASPVASDARTHAGRNAVETVLDSPRSTRDLLHALTVRAKEGELTTGEHTATVVAAEKLFAALVTSGTIRRR